MSHELVPTMTLGELVGVITRHVHQAFGADVVVLLRGADGRLAAPSDPKEAFELDEQQHTIAQWAFDHWQIAGVGSDRFPTSRTLFVPLGASSGRLGILGLRSEGSRQLSDVAVRGVLETFEGQAAVALERARALRAEEKQAGPR